MGYDMTTSEGRRDFVGDNWDLLAYFAYEGYLEHGRGVVLIEGDENHLEDVRYIPLDALRGELLEIARLRQRVKDYNPDQEIICTFIIGAGAFASAHIRPANLAQAPMLVYSKYGCDMLTLEGRNQFVRDTWEALAPYAYEGYLQHGRGVVVIRGEEDGPQDPQYTPLDMIGPDTPPELAQYVMEYDPDQEFVCMFVLGDVAAFARYILDDPAQAPAILHSVLQHGGKTQ